MTTKPLPSPKLPDLDLDRLEALARAATAGPWLHRRDPSNPGAQHCVKLAGEHGAWVCDCIDNADRSKIGGIAGERNAAFIADANPSAVLALIALARRAQPEGEAPQATALRADHRATIEEAAQVLESAAAHNRFKGRTVLEREQQDRANRLRAILSAQHAAPATASRDAHQLASLILKDPDGGRMVISSALESGADGAMWFSATNPETRAAARITISIEHDYDPKAAAQQAENGAQTYQVFSQDDGDWYEVPQSQYDRANPKYRRILAAQSQGAQALRYTSDGALAECPCCGSLDVGGANNTVLCYACDLTIKRVGPLQNAIDAWNRRTNRAALAAKAEAPALTPLDYRAQGREEALAIILAESAEDPFSECRDWGTSGAPEDEGSSYWKEDELRKLLHIGDHKHDAYDRAEAMYWQALGEKDEAERQKLLAQQAPFYKPLHDFLSKHEAWDLMGDLQRAQRAAAPGALDADEMTRIRRLMCALGHANAFELSDEYVRGVMCTVLGQAAREMERLRVLLNTPELHDFGKGVVLEAAHQRERWSTSHDAGKEPADWFWLLGYLGGKALRAHVDGNTEKALHHTISTAAALANWHAAILGKTSMRPGIEPPAEVAAQLDGGQGEGGADHG